jgi:general secretion pathway protein G
MIKVRMKKKDFGFTLIELLVAIAIIGILAVVGFASFRSSQKKARDTVRKHDLAEIQKALEMYQNDHGIYPPKAALSWGNEFTDPDEETTLYMKQLPKDPLTEQQYCYQTSDLNDWYQLYANLENANDPAAKLNVSCDGRTYNYGVSSPNITPED